MHQDGRIKQNTDYSHYPLIEGQWNEGSDPGWWMNSDPPAKAWTVGSGVLVALVLRRGTKMFRLHSVLVEALALNASCLRKYDPFRSILFGRWKTMNCSMFSKALSPESNFSSLLSLSQQLESNKRLSSLCGMSNKEPFTNKQTPSLTSKSLFWRSLRAVNARSQSNASYCSFSFHHGLST